MEFKDFVQNASKEQLTALGTLGMWMQEKVPLYCTCPSKCNQNCQLAKELNEALMLAGKRLQSI
jgi:hypothetical protein